MQRTKIGYLTHTWNPIAMRCTPVSAGCAHCWHLRMAKRLAVNTSMKYNRREAFAGEKVYLNQVELASPLRLRKPARIGVQFMGDLFHEAVPDYFIDMVFAVMLIAERHRFIVLTKRPDRMFRYLSNPKKHERWNDVSVGLRERYQRYNGGWCEGRWEKYTPNIWLGVSVEDQKTADERIPLLLQTPAAVRFVSYEPALGPVDFKEYLGMGRCDEHPDDEVYDFHLADWPLDKDGIRRCNCGSCAIKETKGIDWIIMGGEKGPGSRPMHPDWARSVRDQCQAAGIPFHFKQWGEYSPICSLPVKPWPPKNSKSQSVKYVSFDYGRTKMFKVGHKRAGRLLDGKEYSEIPGGTK